jgi:hypothetical protein
MPLLICLASDSSFRGLCDSHSQHTRTFQPAALSARCCRRSRRRLLLNFSCQNSRFDRGVDAKRQPVCRCQKHPCTKRTVLYRGKTRSGVPGRSRRCRRNRRPSACSARLTSISGLVSRPVIPAIILLRTAGLTVSIRQKSAATDRAIPVASLGGTALPTC